MYIGSFKINIKNFNNKILKHESKKITPKQVYKSKF